MNKYYRYALFLILGVTTLEVRSQTSYDQLANYYEMFDNVQLNTDFLLNRGFLDPASLERSKLTWDSQHSGYVVTDPSLWELLYERLRLSHVSLPLLADFSSFWNSTAVDYRTNTTIPIGIVNMNGEYLDPDLIEANFDLGTGKIKSNAPMELVRLFSVSNLQGVVYSGNITFNLDTQLYFSDRPDQVLGLEIDFDDGNGYSYYNWGNLSIPVSYSTKGEKSIRYKLFLSSDTLLSYSSLDVQLIEAAVPAYSREIAPETTSNGRTTATVAGGVYEVHLGCDHILDKPIILVEGFDPLKESQPNDLIEKYSDIGIWTNLSASGYDLVALKFNNNHDGIENNAQVLKRLIDEVNTDKEGNFENIIIGESMGGLVTRVALAQMEADNLDHETGLYISFDSPHKGANTPLGLQEFGHDLLDIDIVPVAEFLLKAINFLSFGLALDGVIGDLDDAKDLVAANNALAARQMLIRHRHYPNEISQYFLDFQGFLNTTGYPSTSRNIALINGSNNAGRQAADDANNLLDIGEQYIDKQIGCRCCGFKANLDVWVSPVNTSMKVSDVEIRIQAGILPCVQIKTTDKNGNGTFDAKPWDLSPGGFTDADGGNGRDQFSFVPTVSSIDLDQTLIDGTDGTFYYNEDGATNRRKAEIIRNNQTPFDDIYSDPSNTFHLRESGLWLELGIIEEQEIMHEDMYLQNRVIESSWLRDYEANHSITTGNDITPAAWMTRGTSEDNKIIDAGDFIIESGAEVTFTAGNNIVLSQGFHARSGAIFKASTAPSSGACNQPNARLMASQGTARGGYSMVLPLPEIGITKSKDHQEVVFEVSNYPASIKETPYQWVLRGESTEMNSSGRTFAVSDLKGGQYSIRATVNGTKSRSRIFTIPATKTDTEVENPNFNLQEADVSQRIVYPNPSSGELKIHLHMAVDSPLKISILDLNGRLIKNLSEEFRALGDYDEVYDISDLNSGKYIIKIETKESKVTRKLIIQ